MYGFKGLFTLLILLVWGCAGIASMGRLETFQEEEKTYRTALRDSDFKTASKFVDPEAKKSDIHQYRLIKVVSYKTVQTHLSEDKSEIRQEVEIEYYHKTRPVLNTIQDYQLWAYDPEKKVWLLKSGFPKFE